MANQRHLASVPTTPASRRVKRALLRSLELTYDELRNRLDAILTIKPFVDRWVAILNAEKARLEAQYEVLLGRLLECRGQIALILGRHLAAAAEADGNEMEEIEDEDLWEQLLLLSSLMEEDADWEYTADEHFALAREVRPCQRMLEGEEEKISKQLDWYKEVIFHLAAEVEMDALRV